MKLKLRWDDVIGVRGGRAVAPLVTCAVECGVEGVGRIMNLSTE
jgi:hypothetical protein